MDPDTLRLALLELAERLAGGAITREEYDAAVAVLGEGEE